MSGPMDRTNSAVGPGAEREEGEGEALRPVDRDVAQVLAQLGGRAGAKQLRAQVTKRQLARAVSDGTIVRTAHGRYALPAVAEATTAAERLGGALALRSAAVAHGWPVKTPPPVPEVAVHPQRKIAKARRAGVRLLWAEPLAAEVAAGVTAPLRTVVDCARHLRFDEALAIVDSALRAGAVTRAQLDAVEVAGAGAVRVARVLAHADGRAANPFESVLRSFCLDAGLAVRPQVAVDMGSWVSHPDLVDVARRLVIEGDSHTFHTEPVAFAQDCERYNTLVLRGWRVVRFTWEHVMRQERYVRSVLRQLGSGPDRPDEVRRPGRRAA
jgi:very-short-patch-repair endonuclease